LAASKERQKTLKQLIEYAASSTVIEAA